MSNLGCGAIDAAIGLGAAFALLFLMPSCGTPVKGRAFDPAAPTFPSVKGESLNRRSFEIPEGLDAPYNILLVAFFQRQQDDVNTWLGTCKDVVADHANVEYYELPTISSGWGMARGWVDGGMRSGIPAFAARERTVTIYTDTVKFRELAGIDDPQRIWVGIVDRQGRVYWSARGPASAEMLRDLRDVVRRVASPSATGGVVTQSGHSDS